MSKDPLGEGFPWKQKSDIGTEITADGKLLDQNKPERDRMGGAILLYKGSSMDYSFWILGKFVTLAIMKSNCKINIKLYELTTIIAV